MKIQPRKSIFSFEEIENEIVVSIPSHKNIPFIVLMSLGFLGGVAAFVAVSFGEYVHASGDRSFLDLIVPIVGSIILLVFLGFALYVVLWSLFGREIIRVDADTLGIQRRLFWDRQPKDYEIASIRALRVTVVPYDPFHFFRSFGLAGGPIAFDYGAETVRFGAGIQEAEAEQVLDLLSKKAPQLRGAA
jgi:hypothetical protein